MSDNPLKQYFRQPALYVKLPTQGKWYKPDEVEMNADGEIAVYPMGAMDDILINTPDAMLNGQALEKVIKNCAPEIKNVKKLLIPDLDAILLGIKSATNNGKIDFERNCPKCKHENSFDINANFMLDTISIIDPSLGILDFDENLTLHIKPYNFEMRQLWIRKEFEEERSIKAIEQTAENLDEIDKAKILSESVGKIASMTFSLVARSIEKIYMKRENITVTNPEHIGEWLMGINTNLSEGIIESVNNLNQIGIQKTLDVSCQNCGHSWNETLNFDPTSFFGKRSRQGMHL